MQLITTISHKGQVVVPKKIRDKLNLSISDQLIVTTHGDKIIMKPASSVSDVFGMFKTKKKITKKDIKDTYKKVIDKKFSK